MDAQHFIYLFSFAAFIVGVSKGGLASATALAVPFLSLWMDPLKAATILLPVYIISDWASVWLYRKDFSKKNVLIMAISTTLGVLLATALTPYLSESVLVFTTGLAGFGYCVSAWIRRKKEKIAQAPSWTKGLFWGVLTGVASFIAHAGAPSAQAYLIPQQLPKLKFAGTITMIFAICNALKIPSYYALGLFSDIDLKMISILAVVAMFGVITGRIITKKLPHEIYMKTIMITLFFLSLSLIGKSIYLWIA